MNIGFLRHRVTFQRATEADNAFGESVQTWVVLKTVWARVEAISGKERYSAMQTQADVNHRIVCRYQATLDGLAPNDRATWNGKTFDIKSVINTEGRNVELQVFVKEHI